MLIALLGLVLTARSLALTEASKKVGDELVTTLQQELKDAGGDENNRDFALKQYIRQVQAGLAQENSRQLEQALDNNGNYDPTPKVLGFVTALKKDIKDDLKQRTQAVIAEVEGILATARETLVRAEEPEELDKLLVTLSRNRFINQGDNQGYDSNDVTLRGLLSELSNARQFVKYWQDYLQASNSGDVGQASQALRNLSSQETTLIPRSQVIARLDFEKNNGDALSNISQEIKTLDDMKPAIQKLSKMQKASQSSDSDSTSVRATVQTLASLERTYREFLAGLPVDVGVLYQSSDSSDSLSRLNFIQLRADLLLLVLPRYLDLPEDFKPQAGDTVNTFLDRAAEDATRRADTAASRRIRDTRQLFARSGSINSKDQDALSEYAAGQNQLAARQYLLAVVSFQKALKSGSDLIPAGKTGELLDSIKKEHPEDYEAGMIEFLTPRTAPEFDYSKMPYRGYMDPRMMRSMHGYQEGKMPGTNIILPVPAREEMPAAKGGEKAKPPVKTSEE